MPGTYKLGLLGAGNMAHAVAGAAIEHDVLPAEAICCSDPSPDRCEMFAQLGVSVLDSNKAVVEQSEQVVLAIKPQVYPTVAAEIAPSITADHIIITIMAGITCRQIAGDLGGSDTQQRRVVRLMPNTPMMAGLGMAGLTSGPDTEPGDDALAYSLFSAAGHVIRVEEDMIDSITAISGSGPAYVYYVAEAMMQAADELGLGKHDRLLVTQTLKGAVAMLETSEDTAAELRRKVTSPGGTTHAAIEHMESKAMRQTIVDAIKAAHARGRELAGG